MPCWNTREVESVRTPAARADSIAHALKKTITEKMDEDPAFYKKFSKLIEEAIEDYRAQRISDLEYLKKAGEYRNSVVLKKHDDVPTRLEGREDAQAYYGVALPFLQQHEIPEERAQEIAADIALAVDSSLQRHAKVNFRQLMTLRRRRWSTKSTTSSTTRSKASTVWR